MRVLSGPHSQTLAGALLRPRRPLPLRRERWELPDGDFLDLDHLEAPQGAPHLLVLHGLEGSSRSGYVLATLREAQKRGWGAIGFNFRSCSGEPNRQFRSYSSGETADPLAVLTRLRELGIRGPLLGIGFSLGGNVLLKLLAESGDHCPLAAAVAVSTPFDLALCADALDRARGLSAIYRRAFLRTLIRKADRKAHIYPGSLEHGALKGVRTLRAFDDRVTGPAYGFRDAADYYAHCSSRPMLHRIRRPTWLLSAWDDPMVPPEALPKPETLSPTTQLTVTERGGHVGFVGGNLLCPRFWAEEQAVAFLGQAFGSTRSGTGAPWSQNG